MKSMIILAAVAALTFGNAIAAIPGAGSPENSSSHMSLLATVTMAEQELPFDRYWSKN